jgi:hypothetical protein
MRRSLALLVLLPFLSSCGSAKIQGDHRLIISMDPPQLQAGSMIQVSAVPVPPTEMAWVSGTVKVMGAPVMPFQRQENGTWTFKTMIPIFASITPGQYQANAWGESKDGQRYEGSLVLNVK